MALGVIDSEIVCTCNVIAMETKRWRKLRTGMGKETRFIRISFVITKEGQQRVNGKTIQWYDKAVHEIARRSGSRLSVG